MKKTLYIHIPFCKRKCLYCSFIICVAQQKRINTYLECLFKEAKKFNDEKVDSIYFGGGTPSFLKENQLSQLVDVIRRNFLVDQNGEFTIEVNPDDITAQKASLLYRLGFNRISLGVQSFEDTYLKFLGRCHTTLQAQKAFLILRSAGFNNINVDLMFGFPKQTLKELEKDVACLLALNCDHISLYSLTIEKHSRFFINNIQPNKKSTQKKHYQYILKTLSQADYVQYEISNFSKRQKESKHNMTYWLGGNYIGLGVGAHSHNNGCRKWNVSKVSDYIVRIQNCFDSVDGSEILSDIERLKETLVFALRMNKGVHMANLEKRFSCVCPVQIKNKIHEFVENGFLIWEHGYLKTTLKGKLVLDQLCPYLL